MQKADISFLPPDDPDMDRPAVTGRQFEDGTRTAVRTLSSKYGTQVVFAGDNAATDGSMVMLPSNPPDAVLTKRQAHVGRGFANHEALHNLLTDFDGAKPTLQRWEKEGKNFTRHMSQAVEDVRIENGGAHLYPGMAKSIDKTAEYVCRRFVEQVFVDNPEIAKDPWAILPLAVTWAGRLRIGYPSPVIHAAFDKLDESVRKRAERVVDAIMGIPHGVTGIGTVDREAAYDGCRQGLQLAETVANELAKETQEQEQQQGPGGEGGGGDGEGGGGSAGSGDDGPGGQGGGGEGESGGEPAGGHGPSAGDGREPTPEEARSIDPNLDHAVVDLMTGSTETGAYRPFTRSCDEWLTKKSARLGRAAKEHGPHMYAQQKSKISSSLATMRRKLERALIARDNRVYAASRSGKLDVRRRGVGILTGDEMIYKKRADGEDMNAVVQILVDLSGSMSGDKAQVATQSCIAIAEAMAATTVPLEILGHQTSELGDRRLQIERGRQTAEYLFDESGQHVRDENGNAVPNPDVRTYSRFEAVRMYVFKEFDQPLTQARPVLGTMPMMVDGANADADAIMYAAERLLARDEQRKILLVMADGYPAWHCSHGKAYTHERTRDAVEWCSRKGIDIVGVGIQSGAVRKFFPRYTIVESVDALGKTVLDEVARLILGERFRVDNKDLLSSNKDRARQMSSAR